jgi:hypothetical protein
MKKWSSLLIECAVALLLVTAAVRTGRADADGCNSDCINDSNGVYQQWMANFDSDLDSGNYGVLCYDSLQIEWAGEACHCYGLGPTEVWCDQEM